MSCRIWWAPATYHFRDAISSFRSEEKPTPGHLNNIVALVEGNVPVIIRVVDGLGESNGREISVERQRHVTSLILHSNSARILTADVCVNVDVDFDQCA